MRLQTSPRAPTPDVLVCQAASTRGNDRGTHRVSGPGHPHVSKATSPGWAGHSGPGALHGLGLSTHSGFAFDFQFHSMNPALHGL